MNNPYLKPSGPPPPARGRTSWSGKKYDALIADLQADPGEWYEFIPPNPDANLLSAGQYLKRQGVDYTTRKIDGEMHMWVRWPAVVPAAQGEA